MRRNDREITDFGEIIKIIDQCKVCRVAMIDNGKPYIVPMNFGYEYKNKILSLFFHSAAEGRKINSLKSNNFVCFEADCGHELVENDVACKNGFLFESVIGEGYVTFILEPEEKKQALNMIMKHQCGKLFGFDDNSVINLAVYKIEVTVLSGKRCGK